MSWDQALDLIAGFARLAFPIVAVVLAALFFIRVRIINIALDGQMAVAAALYVAGTQVESPFAGLLLALLGSGCIGALIVALTRDPDSDSILITFGVLYASLGIAGVIADWTSGDPGNAPLPGSGALGFSTLLVAGWLTVLLAVASLLWWHRLRVSKVVGLSVHDSRLELTTISGIAIGRWAMVNALVGSLLLAVAALYLVEFGDGYTKAISGDRGFLALAIVSVAMRSLALCIGLALLFAVGQKVAMQSSTHSELLQVLPFAVAILILVVEGTLREMRGRTERPLDVRIDP